MIAPLLGKIRFAVKMVILAGTIIMIKIVTIITIVVIVIAGLFNDLIDEGKYWPFLVLPRCESALLVGRLLQPSKRPSQRRSTRIYLWQLRSQI